MRADFAARGLHEAWVTQAKRWVTQWKSLGDPVENPA